MIVKLTTLLIFSLILTVSHAQAEPWQVSLDASLLANQNFYSDNWTGGETGSIAWTINSNLVARKVLSPKLKNKSTLKLAYGQTHSQDPDSNNWEKPRKSTDLIDLETLFRFTLGLAFDPYVAGRFESQFFDLSDTVKTRYINPMKFTESLGGTRSFVEEDNREWSIRFGFAFRQQINRDVLVLIDTLTYKRETDSWYDGGFELVNDFTTTMAADKITYTSKLILFKAIMNSKADELEPPEDEYWKTIDVNWENIFTANITKYLMVNFYMQFIYDKEEDLIGRFKQTLSLGLTYNIK